LSGSYKRSTAIRDIHDVDVLLFRRASDLDRTPNAVVLEVARDLEDYPGATVEIRPQRRSVRLHFVDYDLFLDIVPCVALDDHDGVLRVPDRPKKKWIDSAPLEYAGRLSELNKKHGERVVRLIKLIKAWRDVQMTYLQPSSYVLEIMIVKAIEDGKLTLNGRSWPGILEDLFTLWSNEYAELLEEDDAVPEIEDRHLDTECSTPWERAQFETFMRRVEEARKAAGRANAKDEEKDAAAEWAKVFGEHWPEQAEVEAQARAEALAHQPGRARISGTGLLVGPGVAGVPSRPTQFHGGRASPQPRIPRTDRPLEQVVPMAEIFPAFTWRPNAEGGLTWRGTLQPTPESPVYRVRIIHSAHRPPRVYVDSHRFEQTCRHLYRDDQLCLYWPKRWWWTVGESLPETIVAWAALWLYFYELWQVTGEWLAPSSPHGVVR
jgi:hypothetical protein